MNIHDQDTFRRGKLEGISEGIQQGISQGELQAKIQTAKNLLKMSLSIQDIAKATGLPKETVEQLTKEI